MLSLGNIARTHQKSGNFELVLFIVVLTRENNATSTHISYRDTDLLYIKTKQTKYKDDSKHISISRNVKIKMGWIAEVGLIMNSKYVQPGQPEVFFMKRRCTI